MALNASYPRPEWCGFYGVADKTTRAADIRQAQTYWTEYQERREHEPPDKNYRESLLQALQEPQEAAEYLTAALEEGDSTTFLLALRDVADARGMSTLAAKAQLNRESLYRMLSEHGNPQLDSLTALLDALDLRLAVTVK